MANKTLKLDAYLDFVSTATANVNNRNFRLAFNYSTNGVLEVLVSDADGNLPSLPIVTIDKDGKTGIGVIPSEVLHVKAANLKGARVESSGNSPVIDLRTSAGVSSNRNFRMAINYSTNGTFEILRSTADGSAPTVSDFTISQAGNIGINNTSPAAKAILDIVSTTKGVLLPRMTNTQMNAITAPNTGLMIQNSDYNNRIFRYNGTAWVYDPVISTGTSAPTTTPVLAGDLFINTTGAKVYAATGNTSSDDWTILN